MPFHLDNCAVLSKIYLCRLRRLYGQHKPAFCPHSDVQKKSKENRRGNNFLSSTAAAWRRGHNAAACARITYTPGSLFILHSPCHFSFLFLVLFFWLFPFLFSHNKTKFTGRSYASSVERRNVERERQHNKSRKNIGYLWKIKTRFFYATLQLSVLFLIFRGSLWRGAQDMGGVCVVCIRRWRGRVNHLWQVFSQASESCVVVSLLLILYFSSFARKGKREEHGKKRNNTKHNTCDKCLQSLRREPKRRTTTTAQKRKNLNKFFFFFFGGLKCVRRPPRCVIGKKNSREREEEESLSV